MSYVQAFIFTPVGAISAYLAIGVVILAAGWVGDQIVATIRRKD